MALHVPKAPGFASMMKDGAKYTHGKQLNSYLIPFYSFSAY